MKLNQIYTLILLLLVIIVAGNAACSTSKTEAQSLSESKPEVAQKKVNKDDANSSKSTYQPPKRISKDIIK